MINDTGKVTAAEAKNLADKGGRLDPEKLKDMYTIIETKASVGQHQTSMNNYVGAKAIIEVLIADGFGITPWSDRDGDGWTITW